MMMVALATKHTCTLAGFNLWQSGVRSLFKFVCLQNNWTDDQTWMLLRSKLVDKVPSAEEWELQTVRAILVEEVNITLEFGLHLYSRVPDSTPLLDALQELMQIDTKDKDC